MRIIFLFLAGMLIGTTSWAQKSEGRALRRAEQKESYLNGKLFGKFNLFGVADPTTPTAQFGLEYRLNEKLGAEITVGLPLKTNTDTVQHRFYKLKAELKYYPTRRFLYVSPELTFLRYNSHVIHGRYFGEDGEDYDFDEGTLRRKAIAIAFKVGVATPVSKRMHLDFSTGLGVRYQNIKVDATNVRESAGFFLDVNKKHNQEGSRFTSHFVLQAKLGYKIF